MKKPSRKNIVKRLDSIFSKYIRNKYADKKGMVKCFTCDREYPIKSIQNGHFMSRKNYATRWDEDNCRPQCYGCNVMKQGMQYEFGKRLGKEKAEEMYLLSKKTVKLSDYELLEMLDHYKEQLDLLTTNQHQPN